MRPTWKTNNFYSWIQVPKGPCQNIVYTKGPKDFPHSSFFLGGGLKFRLYGYMDALGFDEHHCGCIPLQLEGS